jgi:hypothetical protein
MLCVIFYCGVMPMMIDLQAADVRLGTVLIGR